MCVSCVSGSGFFRYFSFFVCLGVQGALARTDFPSWITNDTVIGAAGSPYLVESSVFVDEGATLTLEAGVRVEFAQDGCLEITDGRLEAVGTAGSPIVFTGTQEEPGWWGHIRMASGSTALLEHCEIAYAGRDEWRPVISLADGAQLTMRHGVVRDAGSDGLEIMEGHAVLEDCVFRNNRSGARVWSDGQLSATNCSFINNAAYGLWQVFGLVVDYKDNVFTNNALGGVGFDGGALAGTLTLGTTADSYVFTEMGAATVAQGGALVIGPGARLLFSEHGEIEIGGTLTAEGTEDAPVVFSGLVATNGFWKGITMVGSGSAVMRHCEVAYAGASGWFGHAGVTLRDGASLDLRHSVLHHSGMHGLSVSGTGTFVSVGNVFRDHAQCGGAG